MTSLKCGLRLGKDSADQLHVSIIRAYVHAAIVAHDEALNGALVGMETGIDCDQPSARLEDVCYRPQHAGTKGLNAPPPGTSRTASSGRGSCSCGRSRSSLHRAASSITDAPVLGPLTGMVGTSRWLPDSVIRAGKTDRWSAHLARTAFAFLVVRNHVFESPMHRSHERADAPRMRAGEYFGTHQIGENHCSNDFVDTR